MSKRDLVLWRLPLLPTLLVAVLLEVVLHRAVLQLIKPQLLEPETAIFRLFNEGIGPVAFFFALLLALACLTWGLYETLRSEDTFALPWRIVIGLFSCVLLPIAIVGGLMATAGLKAPDRSLLAMAPYLNGAFSLMVAAILSALLSRPAPILAKVGVSLLALPLFLFAYYGYYAAGSLGGPPGAPAQYEQVVRAAEVAQHGRAVYTFMGYWVFLCFVPLIGLGDGLAPGQGSLAARARHAFTQHGRVLGEVGPLLVGLGVGLGFGVAVKLLYPIARSLAEAVMAYDLPPPSAAGLLPVGSATLLALTLAALAWRPGPTRMVAAGLLALISAGFQLAEPLHHLLALVGLLAVAIGVAQTWERASESALAATTPMIPEDRWQRFLVDVARGLFGEAPPGAAVARWMEGGTQAWQLRGTWRGLPLQAEFARREGRVLAVTIRLGEEGVGRPDWALVLASGRPGVPGAAPELRMEIQDHAMVTGRLLTDPLRERLRDLVRGRVEVWLGAGLRYGLEARWDVADLGEVLPLAVLAGPVEAAGDAPRGRFLALCDLLADLAVVAEVPPVGEPAETAG